MAPAAPAAVTREEVVEIFRLSSSSRSRRDIVSWTSPLVLVIFKL